MYLVDKIMELWAWGANNYGQLGVSAKCEQIDRPVKIQLPLSCNIDNNTFQIAGGGGHTLLTDSDNEKLYSVGWNNKGQLGLENDFKDVETFKEVRITHIVKDNSTKIIKKIACGWDFSLVLFSNGAIFGCGSNAFGQLGLSEEIKNSSKLHQIPLPPEVEIVDMSCGMRHSLFLDGKGNVYSTGCGKKGQLGLGESIKRVFTPTKIHGISSALSVHCGQHFSVLLTTSQTGRDMYTFGDNKYKQVSNSITNTIFTPELKYTSCSKIDEKFIGATCGWTHTVILDQSKGKTRLITWGRNTYGQLGSQAATNDEGHAFVNIEDEPTKIASGYEHNLVVTKSGNLYAWGWNEHSNCGIGSPKDNILIPHIVPMGDKAVLNCYVGSAHSFALLK